MMGRQVAQGTLFYEFRLDDHVPADHLLRRIDGLLEFSFVRDALAASYSATGRPSIDPELMLRSKRAGQTADYAACATGSKVCVAQFQGMSSSHRAAGQSAAIFPVTSAM